MDVLKNLGLSEKEQEIYLALLKFGESSVGDLKKHLKIERTAIYKILERLKDKNFVTEINSNKKKIFKPIEPEKILFKIRKDEELLKQAIPELNSLYKQNLSLTKVSTYSGEDGLKELGELFLTKVKEYFVIGESGLLEKILPIYSSQFMKKIEERKIKEKVLVEYGKKVVESKNSEIRFLPKEMKFPNSTIIFSEGIILVNWEEPKAILIEDKNLSVSYNNIFELLWNTAKKSH